MLYFEGPEKEYSASITYTVIKNLLPLVAGIFESSHRFTTPKELYDKHGFDLCTKVFEDALVTWDAVTKAKTKGNPAGYLYLCFRNAVIDLYRRRFPVNAYLWQKVDSVLADKLLFRQHGRTEDRIYQLSVWQDERGLYKGDPNELHRRARSRWITVTRRELPDQSIRFEAKVQEIVEVIVSLFESAESALPIWQVYEFVVSCSSQQDASFDGTLPPHDGGTNYDSPELPDPDTVDRQPDETLESMQSVAEDFVGRLNAEQRSVAFWLLTDGFSEPSVRDSLEGSLFQFILENGNPSARASFDFQWIGERVKRSENTIRNRLDGPHGLRIRLRCLKTENSLESAEYLKVLILVHQILGKSLGLYR